VQTQENGYVTFLSPSKKVTKEIGIGEALRKCALPYVPHPPHRRPAPENVPIFGSLLGKTFVFLAVGVQKSEHFGTPTGDAAQGFLRGGAPRSEFIVTMIASGNHTTLSLAFSECPLESPSFGPFPGEARKGQDSTFL